MTSDFFATAVAEQLRTCAKLLDTKGEEYAPDADIDRLAHFKKAASIMGGSTKSALFGMLAKHIVSLSDMCTDGREYSAARWSEKITDSINYLLILGAMVKEESNG